MAIGIDSVAAEVTSLILCTQVSFVPDEYLGDWMANLSWQLSNEIPKLPTRKAAQKSSALLRSVELPLVCFIISIIAWAMDLSWQGGQHKKKTWRSTVQVQAHLCASTNLSILILFTQQFIDTQHVRQAHKMTD